ncbi:3'-5' exonuclease eri-1 [Frankliniella fusca]|uniref:3'-5' exonuclease eri-1 n=1 Tax=Frankliniella fusca TaxID=407009 RepID=A0AAE1H7R7_9NEOP|nr:3'-5' exonuclease eri-1 [Frankliniella fusca]
MYTISRILLTRLKSNLPNRFLQVKKVLFTHSVRLVNVSITLYNDLKSRGGSLSSRPRRPWLKDGRRHSARASTSNKPCLHNVPT